MNEWINHHHFTGTYVGEVGDCLDCGAMALAVIDDLITTGAALAEHLSSQRLAPSTKRRVAKLESALEAAVCKGSS